MTNEVKLPELDVTEPIKPSAHKSKGYTSSNRTYSWQWVYAEEFDEYAKEVTECLKERERQLLRALELNAEMVDTLEEVSHLLDGWPGRQAWRDGIRDSVRAAITKSEVSK